MDPAIVRNMGPGAGCEYRNVMVDVLKSHVTGDARGGKEYVLRDTEGDCAKSH